MTLIVRDLQLQPYEPIWQAMHAFTDSRTADTMDEIWLVEHQPVYTQGQAGKAEHLLNPNAIPVVQVDRGGQITYHGPGQQMMYVLLNIKRLKVGVRQLVTALEECIVAHLAQFNIRAYPKKDAPGVYVNEQKICSIGLRIRKGCSFHGLALNVNMDLTPFNHINPCGYAGLEMTDSARLGGAADLAHVGQDIVAHFCTLIGVQQVQFREGFDE